MAAEMVLQLPEEKMVRWLLPAVREIVRLPQTERTQGAQATNPRAHADNPSLSAASNLLPPNSAQK